MLPNRVPSCSSILFSQQSKEFRRLGNRCHWMQGIAFSFKVRQGGLNIGYRCDDLYSDLWRACAGPRVDVPKISERVYYFPQGRMEQVRLVIPKLICIDLGFID